jgi:hypothetical protein
MNIVLPRLDRASTERVLERYRREPLATLSSGMPDETELVTYAAVGGARIDRSTLEALRGDILGLAADHGMPEPIREVSGFEGRAAQVIRRALPMSPHEASQEEVWSYLTCCWLLDVAIWRFGESASDDRFIGHVNRNTFRRMWWREEVLGSTVDLTRLGEDELVNIMERPTLYVDARLAQAIAREFLSRVDGGDVPDRMRLMREATKRLLRLTPFLAFMALADEEVDLVVADAFDAALAGLRGQPAAMPQRTSEPRSEASPDVEGLAVLRTSETTSRDSHSRDARTVEFEEVARAAIEIARATGRVTNTSLRELAVITSGEAREILQSLMERRELVRRGKGRGTYYEIPEGEEGDINGGPQKHEEWAAETPDNEGSSETALRRLLRRTTEE